MNRVDLIGDLVSPVQVRRDWSTGRTMGRAILAVPHEAGMDLIPVTLWGREAVDAARYLGEGSTVAVKGHIHSGFLAERVASSRPGARCWVGWPRPRRRRTNCWRPPTGCWTRGRACWPSARAASGG